MLNNVNRPLTHKMFKDKTAGDSTRMNEASLELGGRV